MTPTARPQPHNALPATDSAACPICGNNDTEFARSAGDVALLRCRRCALIYCPEVPEPDARARYYDERYFTDPSREYGDYLGEEAVHRRQARYYLGVLRSMGITAGRLLDVGCATGFFLDEARQAGFEVVGCDVSGFAVAHACEVLGLHVVQGDFLEADLPPRSFDVITLFNVLEHLPDQRAVARKLAELLRPGGVLVVETWDYRAPVARVLGAYWHDWAPPFVLYYYTKRTLAALFGSARWAMIGYRHGTKWISARRALEVLGRAPLGVIAHAAERLSRTRAARVLAPYHMGDLVVALLRRQE
jgi:2-polyprenyl-3-methyl-5-hydroxy-6-metoxy-1,4-benzoquinol methylase